MRIISIFLVIVSVLISGYLFKAEFSWLSTSAFPTIVDVIVIVPTVILSVFLNATLVSRAINATADKAQTYLISISLLAVLFLAVAFKLLPVPAYAAFLTSLGTNIYVLVIDWAILSRGRKVPVNMVVSDDSNPDAF